MFIMCFRRRINMNRTWLMIVVMSIFVMNTESVFIDLSSKGLTSFPEITQTTVKYLKLNDNRISYIEPEKLHNLTSLVSLYLENNRFESFPNLSDIGSKLKVLNLKSNQISGLAEEYIIGLHVLRDLNLGSNFLNPFPNLTVLGDTLLKLELSYNGIEYINPQYLEPLQALQELIIHGNKLSRIQDVEHPLPNLRNILMYINQLNDIPPYNLMSTVTGIDLRYNRFTKIKMNHWFLGKAGCTFNLAGNSVMDIKVPQCATTKKFKLSHSVFMDMTPCEMVRLEKAANNSMLECKGCDLGTIIENAKSELESSTCKQYGSMSASRAPPPTAVPKGIVVSVRSIIGCVQQCRRDELCWGVFWSGTERCALYSGCEERPQLTNNEIWTYYEI